MNGESERRDELRGETVALSFREFRDEEIVRFFANDGRSFQSDAAAPSRNAFERNRLVGAPHFVPKGRKPTAEFRAAGDASEHTASLEKKQKSRSVVFREQTRKSVPVPSDLLDRNPILRLESKSPKRTASKPSELSLGKPARPLGSVLLTDRGRIRKGKAARVLSDPLSKKARKPPFDVRPNQNEPNPPPDVRPVADPGRAALERLSEIDDRLNRLVESWPRLSSRLKETIATLLEVGIKKE